ncbi:cation-translocating P-type ATPase [Mycobacterium camsae]|uniref:hypothetical protein n=1 Tax=Mycobacterium gordonae TaxID=1778 RepID=UPI001F11D2FD|nr:hypothetical protein [Mycobacterium gordonae]
MPAGAALADLTDLALMGTIVSGGEATAVVYATGRNAEFGRIAAGLDTRQPETGNLLLHKPVIDSVLFSLAIAVGITPQLLPVVVSTSLATGSRRLARVKVLVKRLVCIEDLGDIDSLMTDKTGTLTEGRIRLVDTIDATGAPAESVLRLGLLATDVAPESGGASANALDAGLWEAPKLRRLATGARRVALSPFDHQRRATSALVDDAGNRRLIVKGGPSRC